MSYVACFLTVGFGWAISNHFLGLEWAETARVLYVMACTLFAHRFIWGKPRGLAKKP